MADTAFELPTLRSAWHSKAVLSKYDAVQISSDGLYEKATGTGTFVGIVQYGCETIGDMVTVVTGMFPVVATTALAVGDKVTIDSAAPGKVKKAVTAGDKVCGTALTAGAIGTLVTIQTLSVPAVI